MSNKAKVFILSAVLLVVLFGVGSLLFKAQQARESESRAKDKAALLVREHSEGLGSKEAKVTIVEFMDPACETCRAFAPFVKSALEAFPGKIRLVLRYAPLHQGADYAVKVLEAARKQGKYWETLEVMYETQGTWASHHKVQPQLIWQFLPRAGLDIEKLKKDIEDPEIARILAQDMADAQALGVDKTPGFFVNGKPLVTFGADNLKALILSELREKYPE